MSSISPLPRAESAPVLFLLLGPAGLDHGRLGVGGGWRRLGHPVAQVVVGVVAVVVDEGDLQLGHGEGPDERLHHRGHGWGRWKHGGAGAQRRRGELGHESGAGEGVVAAAVPGRRAEYFFQLGF